MQFPRFQLATACLLAVGTGSCLFPDDDAEDPAPCRERLERRETVRALVEAARPDGEAMEDRGRRRPVDLVWPLSGTDRPAGRFSGTFGPRIKVSQERYDFHRGLDLPAETGTAIHAVADGKVRLAGPDEEYSDPVVQIEHHPDRGEAYYSNYLHLSSWSVDVGETVEQGDKIAEVGESASGFPHLHVEIREGGLFRHHCVHPLSYLPYDQTDPPTVDRVAIDRERGRVSLSVVLPHTELDLVRLGVAVRGEDETVTTTDVDLVRTNAGREDWKVLDDPGYRSDLRLDPETFRSTSEQYRLDATFRELDIGAQSAVMAFADDIGGTQSRRFLCAP